MTARRDGHQHKPAVRPAIPPVLHTRRLALQTCANCGADTRPAIEGEPRARGESLVYRLRCDCPRARAWTRTIVGGGKRR